MYNLVVSKDFALRSFSRYSCQLQHGQPIVEKAIKPLLQFVYSKFEICVFNIFIVSCYSYCLWYLSHLSMKRHSLETEISQHECNSEKKKYNYHGCLYLTGVLAFKQLHLNISMHILHTVLSKFLKVLKRRICKAIKSFFSRQTFPLWLWP